jgi:hypothetical protein
MRIFQVRPPRQIEHLEGILQNAVKELQERSAAHRPRKAAKVGLLELPGKSERSILTVSLYRQLCKSEMQPSFFLD